MWTSGISDLGPRISNVPPIDRSGIKALIEQKLDFVGVSAYAPINGPGFKPKELENAAFMLGVSGFLLGFVLGVWGFAVGLG